MTRILTRLITANLDNEIYVQLYAPFVFESDVLKRLGLPPRVKVPAGFVYDFESVPLVKGKNKRGGTGHDYFSRKDSVPVVTKAIAAEIYRELMDYTYALDDREKTWRSKANHFARKWFKWSVVRVWPGYFHKHTVMATVKEIAGIDDDPYVNKS